MIKPMKSKSRHRKRSTISVLRFLFPMASALREDSKARRR